MTDQENGDWGQLEESILSRLSAPCLTWHHVSVPKHKMLKGKEMFNLRTWTSFQIYPSSHTAVPLNRKTAVEKSHACYSGIYRWQHRLLNGKRLLQLYHMLLKCRLGCLQIPQRSCEHLGKNGQ